VDTIILSHRIPCTGFLFREKPKPRKLIKEKLVQYNVPLSAMQDIKTGNDFVTEDGKTIPNAELSQSGSPARSYAFCSDTIYDETLIERIHNVDLLYHEATFLDEHSERAKETFHTTASQAATIASKAEVKVRPEGRQHAPRHRVRPRSRTRTRGDLRACK
jgi:ribonuclease Z